MGGITRREAVRAVLASAGGLAAARYLSNCTMPSDGGSNQNANDNSVVDPALRALLEIDEEIDHVEGDAKAPNVIIQYGDFESPDCAGFFRDNRPAVITDLVDSGLARLVFRHFPISSAHPNARLAAIASECAARFFEYHDILFANQAALTRDDLIGYAEEVGLNPETFGNCLSSGSKAPRVQRDLESGAQLGVTSTPTFFVNDRVLTGNHPVGDFAALVD